MSVNINVTTTGTPAAGKQIADFTSQSAAGLLAMAKASQQASAATEAHTAKFISNNRALKSAIGGLALNATLFAGPQAQSLVYPLILMQKELKGLTSAAKIAGLSLPAVGLAVAGVTAAVTTGVFWWQKYKAEMQEIDTQISEGVTAGKIMDRFEKLIESNRARLNPGEADAMLARLFTKDAKGDTGAFSEISARLKQVNLDADQLKKIDELRKKTVELNDAKREGFDKERAEEKDRFIREKAFIEERQKIAKSEQDHFDVSVAYQLNRELNEKRTADIDKRQAAEQLKAQQEISDEIRKREKEADEFYAREDAHNRQIQIDRVSNNPFATDAQKFDQLKALGVQGLGADPRSFVQQMSAGLVQLQNQWGTFQQQIAATFYDTIGGAVHSISDGLTGLILQTKGWQERLAQIPITILTSIVGAIVQMGVRWIATQILMATVGKSIAAASTAALIPIAAAQTAIWSTPAALATISSYGAAAAASPFQVAGAVALTEALSMASLGFREGGFTGSGADHQVAGIVHRNEFVVPADAVRAIGVGNLQAMTSGAGGGSSAPIGAGEPRVLIYFADSESQVRRIMESNVGRDITLRHVGNGKTDLGFPT